MKLLRRPPFEAGQVTGARRRPAARSRARDRRVTAVLAGAAAATVLVAGCSSPSRPKPPPPPTGLLRLGYTTTLADAPVLAGLRLGYYATELGGVTLQAEPFPDTAAEARALQRGQLDAAYLDPMAAVAVWQSGRGGIKIIAGVASGGAELVVRRGITSPKQLAGTVVVAPAASAQEVALDWWLRQHNVAKRGAGNVTMNGTSLTSALKAGRVAGAWEPAPLDAQMTAAGGHVLVDEASLWPGGRFSTAVLVATTGFLARHAAAVQLLLRGHIQAEQLAVTNRTAAQAAAGRQLATAGAKVPGPVLARGFAQMQFGADPLAASILAEAQHAVAAGLLDPVQSLAAMYDLGPLNILLKASGLRQVSV
jgi:NitT/TauT family transport system substrate-binding protein